jgi:3-carboxy-cis,cis-muconate cycloisomerase
MQANFYALHGVSMAEAVSAALSPKIGRSAANQLLRMAARRSIGEKRHLASVLKTMPEVIGQLGPEEIDRLMQPSAYLGSAQRFIARVLGETDGGG